MSLNKPSTPQMVGRGGLEPPTSRLSGVRSNRAELPAQLKANQKRSKTTLPYFIVKRDLKTVEQHKCLEDQAKACFRDAISCPFVL